MDTLRKIYGKDYYSGDKSFKGKQIYKVATEGILKLIIDREYRSGRLLDIGCGTGYFLYVAGGIFETYGVEVSNYAINEARKYINAMLYLLDVCK